MIKYESIWLYGRMVLKKLKKILHTDSEKAHGFSLVSHLLVEFFVAIQYTGNAWHIIGLICIHTTTHTPILKNSSTMCEHLLYITLPPTILIGRLEIRLR